MIRFGHDWDPTCMKMDEVLYSVAEKARNFAVFYLVDISQVSDFNKMYELYDPCTGEKIQFKKWDVIIFSVMFFFRNKHIMIDLGTGNNNKINWAIEDKQEFIDIVGRSSNNSLILVNKLIGRVPSVLGNPTHRRTHFDKLERNRLPWST